MVISCATIVRYNNQEVDSGAVKVQRLPPPQRSLVTPWPSRTHFLPVPPPNPAATHLVSMSIVFLFFFLRRFYSWGNSIRNLYRSTFSLRITLRRCIQVFVGIDSLFLSFTEQHSMKRVDQFVWSSRVEIPCVFSGFWQLWINKAAINIYVWVSMELFISPAWGVGSVVAACLVLL